MQVFMLRFAAVWPGGEVAAGRSGGGDVRVADVSVAGLGALGAVVGE